MTDAQLFWLFVAILGLAAFCYLVGYAVGAADAEIRLVKHDWSRKP